MSLPSDLFLAMFPLQMSIFNKDDGTALANGYVRFWADQAFTVPKSVYKQTYIPSSNTYTYTDLGSVLTLSSIGTFEDFDGNQIIPFLFPYSGTTEEPGDIELYFIEVYSSGGVLQFTRDGWPPNISQGTSPTDTFEGTTNELTNSQFSEVLFTPDLATSEHTFSVSGVDTETVIAPGWRIVTSGSGTVTLKQIQISETNVVSNPPYSIDIDSTGVSNIKIVQRLEASPRLLYGQYVNAKFMAQGQGSTLVVPMSMWYVDSNGTEYNLIPEASTDSSGIFTQFNNTVQITSATPNPDTAPDGYVDIEIRFEALKHVQITSVQLVGVQNESSATPYLEQSTQEEENGLFWYYNPQLQFKPIPSYLTGWDFPLNPSLANGKTIAATASVNAFTWDQTILFQNPVSRINTSQASNGSMVLQATGGNAQAAIIQYLPQSIARSMLGNRLSVNVRGSSTESGGLGCTVSLWYTTNASVPVVPLSVLTSLDSNGHPNGVAAGWTEVSRGSGRGNASFTLSSSIEDYGFSGWDASATSAPDTATFFAIIVGTASITSASSLSFKSVSVVPGDIPTIPAPQTLDEVLRECQYYYEKSYAPGTAVGTVTEVGSVLSQQIEEFLQTNVHAWYRSPIYLTYQQQKHRVPLSSEIAIYSPGSGTANRIRYRVYNGVNVQATGGAFTFSPSPAEVVEVFTTNYASSNLGVSAATFKNITVTAQVVETASGVPIGGSPGVVEFHYVIDVRLGR